MYIEHLTTTNFKCFESITLQFPKLTILTGANSSGKSSLLHAMLVPFQSAGFPFSISPNGKYINMGDFLEMVRLHRRDQRIWHEITLNSGQPGKIALKTEWVLDTRSSLPRLNYLSAQGLFLTIDIQSEASTQKYILSVKLDAKGYTQSSEFKFAQMILPFMESVMDLAAKEAPGRKAVNQAKEIEEWKKMLRLEDIEKERFDNIDDIQKRLDSMPALPTSLLLAVFRNMDKQLGFIDSFRLAPERTYYERAKADIKINRFGENYIDQLLTWERERREEFQLVQQALKKLHLLMGIKTRHLRGGRFEINVKTVRGGVWSSLRDVGFGISQFLPIVVADTQLGRGSTLVVAQPEIHLHPSAQAALGDYLVNHIESQKKRYIIETHSEYLLNRIRLLIVKEKLNPSDVAIYYFRHDGRKVHNHPISFTRSGKIEGAPQDFFNTYMMDVVDIAMNTK